MPMKRRLSLDDMRNPSDDPWIDVDSRKAKRTKNKNKDKTVISVSQPAELIDAVISAVAGDSIEIVRRCCSSTQTESSDFGEADGSHVEFIQCELRQLRDTVATLSSKIDQLSKAILSDFQSKMKSTVPSYASVSSAPAQSAHSATNGPAKSGQPELSTHSSHSRDAHRHDPVTAMYIDLSIRKQRSNNIVITGMQPAQSPEHEIKAVIDLLTVEFGWDTDLCPGVSVARCRRIGKPQDGKFQPLLVTLDTREQAEYYVKNASLLRHSNQPEIRNSVFINPDLTPSEAKAAFEIRQRRRQRRQESAAATNDPSAIPSRTFYQSSSANKKHDKSVHSPPVTNRQNSIPSTTATAAVNLSPPAVDSPCQLGSSPTRLVYRSAVNATPLDDGRHSEQCRQQIQTAPPTCVQQEVVTNNCQFDVAVEVHAPFNDSGRPANSNSNM